MDQNTNPQTPLAQGDASVKKPRNYMLMLFILGGLLIIFMLLVYSIALNRKVEVIGQQETSVTVQPQVTEKVAPSPIAPPEETDIRGIESDLEGLDADLRGL